MSNLSNYKPETVSSMAASGVHVEHSNRMFTSIPVIDISPLLSSDLVIDKAVHDVANQLHAACLDVGFFYVTNHGVPESVYGGILSQARNWFALPEETKSEIAISPTSHYRGFQVLGANVTRYAGGYQRDCHEAIDLYREVEEDSGLTPSPIHGLNPWPHHIPEFKAVIQDFVEHVKMVGSVIMRGIAIGLGLPHTFFEENGASKEDAYWVLRIINYPPLPWVRAQEAAAASGSNGTASLSGEIDRSVQLSCGEHTDYGLLTLVNQENGVTGLQVKNAAGKWIDATPIPGTFVCNIGDMLKVWTNGLYQPTAHRVINANGNRSRVSAPFFYEPGFDAVVAPLVGAGRLPNIEPAYKPIRYGAHLESKVLTNFEL